MADLPKSLHRFHVLWASLLEMLPIACLSVDTAVANNSTTKAGSYHALLLLWVPVF